MADRMKPNGECTAFTAYLVTLIMHFRGNIAGGSALHAYSGGVNFILPELPAETSTSFYRFLKELIILSFRLNVVLVTHASMTDRAYQEALSAG